MMRLLNSHARLSSVFIALVVCGGMGSCNQGANLSGLKEAVKPYKLYEPIRENWGPGFVFHGDVVSDEIRNPLPVCDNLYGDEQPGSPTGVEFGDFTGTDKTSFNLSIDFLKRIIGKDNSAKLKLADLEFTDNVKVRWGNLQEFSYGLADQWLDSGEERPVEKKCNLAIADLKAKGMFDGRVFVITRAVRADSITYEFREADKIAASGELKLKTLLDVNAGAGWEAKGDTVIETNTPFFVAYSKPREIKSWLPSGLVSPNIVKISVQETDLRIAQE